MKNKFIQYLLVTAIFLVGCHGIQPTSSSVNPFDSDVSDISGDEDMEHKINLSAGDYLKSYQAGEQL